MAEEQRKTETSKKKKKRTATLESQEVLSNPLQVVYFNQLEKA